jgi:hypothetical protein
MNMRLNQPTAEYISSLIAKGFLLKDEDIGFIYFGKKYTGIDDTLVNLAIEFTLKIQRRFDGSFYIALLEGFQEEHCENYQDTINYLHGKGIHPAV